MLCATLAFRPGHARQQRRRGGVDVHADRVHAILDHRIERARQLGLADIVLVLADADRFRIDLHQFRQRVLQAARDRHRAAQRHVQLGQFARGEFGGRIDRGAGFRHHDLGQLQFGTRLIRSCASLSVSREAVPLPIEISDTLCFCASCASVCSEPSQSLRGWCG